MAKRIIVPLVIENHPSNYKGYPFITLIQFKDEVWLTVIDNISKKYINAYVLDLCTTELIDEGEFIQLASEWYLHHKEKYPMSVMLNKMGLADQVKQLYKSFNIDYVKRVIGPVYDFKMSAQPQIRKRRVKQISS